MKTRIRVTFWDGNQIVVDSLSMQGAAVVMTIESGDLSELKKLGDRYGCKVQQIEDLFGKKYVDVAAYPSEVKKVEFTDVVIKL